MTETVTRTARRRAAGTGLSKLALLCLFSAIVIVPLVRMLLYITPDSLRRVFGDPTLGRLLGNTVAAALTATVITVGIAALLACCLERTAIRGKSFFRVVLSLPMLIPSISHGMGLILLLGNNGILTNLLHLHTGIYGFKGIVAGSVLYAFPVAFLMLSDVLRYEDSSPYEAARVLGIPRRRQFTAITLPFIRRPLISVLFATFTMIVTDYGVPLMVGGKYRTLPVVMYQEVIGQLHFDRGSVYGAILLIPAVIAFLFDLTNRDRGNAAFVLKPFEPSRRRPVLAAAYAFTGLISLLTALPIASFIILGFARKYPTDMSFSLANIQKVLALRGGDYLLNSVIIAVCVALLGTVLGFVTAYLTARSSSPLSRLLHLIAITAMAIPGIVLGLSYVLVFRSTPLYGTLAILILVNTVHFIASPYLMMYNSLGKINENIEAVGDTLGIGRLRLIRDVFIPQSLPTLAEMFTYFFVNSMMTISAVSFLARTATKPISLMINQFEAQMQLENAAIVSLAILLVNLAVKGTITLLRRKIRR